MCEQSEINYLDGDIVWVKLGSCWWPGEVVGTERLPSDLLPSFRKPPIAVVKFFQEDTYEYVKNLNSIFKYNCSRKNEFINKGLYMYRTKHGLMEKFPEDVIRAETAVGGDITILTREEFQETKKESYAGLFGDPTKKNAALNKKGKGGRGQHSDTSRLSTSMKKFKEKTNYKVHILLQGSKTPIQNNETLSTPSTSRAGSETTEISPEKNTEKSEKESESEEVEMKTQPASFNTPTMTSSGLYVCHACQFSTQRLNVLIMHNKTHSVSYAPYTPSPVKKKLVSKIKSTPVTSKTPKDKKRRSEKSEKKEKKTQSNKRSAEVENISEVKKAKTDEEIKSSLLADWDDGEEESADESSTIVMAGSPEVPMAAESPAVPTPAELPAVPTSAELPTVQDTSDDKKNSPNQKPESSSDSKYEFCEDEDWPVETDVGRKIPRLKNSSKRNGDKKSVSIDEEEMAREVAELLNKTTLPELPSAPEPLKVEENFPEGSIVKSPDKKNDLSQEQSPVEKKTLNDNQAPKTIFKTKTFFRSRHSRSQDAIGKYVAEQLNAAERMDLSESELNGSEVSSSPEIRESPQQIKVARLAPKIQFKKSKAEAALQREIEKHKADKQKEESLIAAKDVNTQKDTIHIDGKEQDETIISNISLPSDNKNNENKENASLDEDITQKHNLKDSTSDVFNDEDSLKTIKEVDSPVNNMVNEKEDVPKVVSYTDKSYDQFMNESTASAVDALLSVSREADRVTKVISDDPPEDLFEDDIKDVPSNVNGFCDALHNRITQNEENENDIGKLHSTENLEDVKEVPDTSDTKIDTSDTKIDTSDTKIDTSDTKTDSSDTKIDDRSEEKHLINSIQDGDSVNPYKPQEGTEKNIEVTKPDGIYSKLISTESDVKFSIENIPSESDLQVAEALINLPTTTLTNKLSDNHIKEASVEVNKGNESPMNELPIQSSHNFSLEEEPEIAPIQPKITLCPNKDMNSRFETEQEKSENLNAAKSLVQMSESVDHTLNISEMKSPKEKLTISKRKEEIENESTVDAEQTISVSINEINNESKTHCVSPDLRTHSPKLLKILEEPGLSKLAVRKPVTKQIVVPRKEKLLNVDAGKSPLKSKTQSPKQKIIIRRTTPSKNLLNNISEISTPDKIILSRTNKSSQDGSSVQTYTIQTSPDVSPAIDPSTIIIQPKLRQVVKPVSKLQKIKSQPQTIITSGKESKITNTKNKDDAVFDINSMPIVLTPESIEKMPIVMSDGNIITNSSKPPKLVKTKQIIADSGKISPGPIKEIKPMIMSTSNEVTKTTTPNILSKSQKIRGTKPMLVIDKTTGKQKIIMTKTEQSTEIKQQPTLIQSAPQTTQKAEKFIILPTQNSPRSGRTQKIVIDPQTGKAHVLVGKSESQITSSESNKPLSAKLIPSPSDSSTPGSTVMIITNAQGNQSRIVLTPEHEKILFPNKQQPALSQLKPITHRITSGSGTVQKTVTSTGTGSTKSQTRIVPKQKSAIITSKGQLIVGGRVATTTQNIAPLPEIRPAPKRILASEPKRLVQAIQKNSSEPLIFLRQNSSAVMQLTVAQFEHLQRTGQIVQKAPVQENKIVLQKSITISPKETISPSLPKQRVRKQPNESPAPSKKLKHEIAIAPAPAPVSMPALTPIAPSQVPNVSSTTTNVSTSNYSDLENLEELLPSTAIARQAEHSIIQSQSEVNQPPHAALSDGQLLAVPGEHFGGPTGSFYLCVEDNGNFTAIDNRPLILENNQLVPMPDPLPVPVQPERRDILEAALANSDVFHAETIRDEAPDFRDLNANVSVHCRVSETSTTLHQPIMTPVEVPSKVICEPTTVPSNLEDGLAVIGVTPHSVPTSLELPITVTDPRIAPKTTDPLSNNNYGPSLLPSPNTELTFSTREDTEMSMVGPISMPILTDDDNVGKSMPILTDEVTERTVSSVDSIIGSPSSIDVRESENEDSQWPRRLLTPCSDTSETSSEIPIQPVIQISINDIPRES